MHQMNKERRMRRWGHFTDRLTVVIEVAWGRFSIGGKLSTRGEETIDLHVGLGLVQAYAALTFRRSGRRDIRLHPFRFEWSLYWMDHALWFSADGGKYDHSRCGERLHWRWNSRKLTDLVLGKKVYNTTEVKRCRSVVPLPEGGMPCEIVWTEATWKRPRWKELKILRAEVTPDTPIGFPGKGDNSWDCGDDAVWSITGRVKATTEHEAVLMVTKSVLSNRELYGRKLTFAREMQDKPTYPLGGQ